MFAPRAVPSSRSESICRHPGASNGRLLATFVILTSSWMMGCGTKTSGVEECRQIESARCVSAQRCGLIEDAPACERYVRDQCRHGFDPSIGPSKSEVNACSAAIEDIGDCAQRSGAKTAPASCRESRLEEANANRVCDLVERPERIPACAFLSDAKSSRVDAGVDRDETETREREAETTAAEDAGSADGGR